MQAPYSILRHPQFKTNYVVTFFVNIFLFKLETKTIEMKVVGGGSGSSHEKKAYQVL